jgi:hypothetical protein
MAPKAGRARDRQIAWAGQRHGNLRDQPSWPLAEHKDAIRQQHCFGDAVCHHKDCDAFCGVQPEQLQVEPLARQARRAGRRVRPSAAGAAVVAACAPARRADSCRRKAGVGTRARSPFSPIVTSMASARLCCAERRLALLNFDGQQDILQNRAPRHQVCLLKDEADAGIGRACGCSSNHIAPPSGGISPPMIRSRVLLPLPLGPTRQTISPV